MMFFAFIYLSILAMLSLFAAGHAARIVHREPCAENYTPCSPPGATSSIVPPVGEALSGLYFDLVSSVNPQPVFRDVTADKVPDQARDVSAMICCAQGTECRLLESYHLAFCWDRFTTNFFLPDGSYGNIFTGYYKSSSGALANLVSGDTALPNGRTGNIYSAIPQAMPVTSLLPVPTPWTSQGLGTAIPNSELGAEPSYPNTAAEPTITPTDVPSFPSLVSTTGATRTPIGLNVTAFPACPTTCMGEPNGYGLPPGSNTSNITPSIGTAVRSFLGCSCWTLCLLLVAYLMLVV